MKKTIVTIACTLIVPLALAQTKSKDKQERVSASESVTVTGAIITTTEEGKAANYQPVKTIVIRQDSSNKPGRYVLNGQSHVVNTTGEVVQTALRPGTSVRV
jgi:hypothetical protein